QEIEGHAFAGELKALGDGRLDPGPIVPDLMVEDAVDEDEVPLFPHGFPEDVPLLEAYLRETFSGTLHHASQDVVARIVPFPTPVLQIAIEAPQPTTQVEDAL